MACAGSASRSRSDRSGWTSTGAATPRSGRRCWPRCATPAGTTTRSSCATTACWSATSRPTTSPPRRRDGRHRGQRPVAGRDGAVLRRLDGGRPDDGCTSSTRCSTSTTSWEAPTMTDLAPATRTRVTRGAARRSGSRRRPGRSATRAPGSRCSRSRACRATRTRRSPTPRPVHRFTGVAPTRRAAHPVGPGRRLRRPGRATPPSRASRSARSTRTCSRTTTTCSAASPTRTPASGARRSTTCSSASTSWTRTGSRDLKLWFSDGTNYPGQDDIRARQDRLAEALRETYDRLGDDQRMLLEYKLFEPAFYTTDVPDWGTAYAHCLQLGEQAPGGHRHRPPRAGHQHRVHRRVPAAGREARRRSTSTPASTPTTT